MEFLVKFLVALENHLELLIYSVTHRKFLSEMPYSAKTCWNWTWQHSWSNDFSQGSFLRAFFTNFYKLLKIGGRGKRVYDRDIQFQNKLNVWMNFSASMVIILSSKYPFQYWEIKITFSITTGWPKNPDKNKSIFFTFLH